MDYRSGLAPIMLIGVGAASACTALLGGDFEVVDGAGGQGGAGGQAGSAGSSPCEPGTVTCADSTTLVECSAAGEPIESQCPTDMPVCVDGACQPCDGSSTRCNGSVVEQCDGGEWAAGETCTIGCDAGACLEVVDIGAGVVDLGSSFYGIWADNRDGATEAKLLGAGFKE